ncbi:putative short-chain type dehydrogenase [Cadophora sp. DSE1049]|nr:putative short-chain type dehydrogenase [Cadophora sp. DSE1049]
MPPPRGTPNPLEGPGEYDVTSKVHSDTYPGISPLSSSATKKSVFIVGASRGIGLAMGVSFAQSGASQIAIGARSSLTTQKMTILAAAKKAGREEPEILIVKLNVSDQKSTEEAAQLVEKEFGKLDIVVNNAGILGAPSVIGDSNPDDWWEIMTTNLKGPYLVSRAFLPLLLKGGDKTIVTTSSVGAHLVGPGMSSYQTSKLAVMRLMQFISEEYKEKGVVAFCFHPGNIMTDILSEFPGGLPEIFKPVVIDTVELPADTVTFLTREPREWLGGRYINSFWDMPELVAMKDDIVKGDKFKVRLVY